ncbi:MAG TPA: FixH family protein [Syntrophales bacterium]|nr:FixH family protein [Syntrophales bacterium]
MKRIIIILAVLMLAFGVAYAKEYTATKKAGGYTVNVKIDKNPPVVGKNQIEIDIKDASGADIADATILVDYGMPAMPGMPAMNYKTKTEVKDKKYMATIDFSMGDAWNLVVKITRAGKTQSVKFNVDVS